MVINSLRSLLKSLTFRYPIRKGHKLFVPIYALRYLSAPNLYVDLNHGLANRLITLASCQAARRIIGKKFIYIWNINEPCGCSFDDLFDNNIPLQQHTRMVDYNDDATFKPAFLNDCKTQFFYSFNFRHYQKGSSVNWEIHNIPFVNGLIDNYALAFHHELSILQPSKDVLRLLPTIGSNTVGVHIRRGDLPWQERSPLYSFQLAMDKLLNKDSTTIFYLASDSMNVKKQMIDRYGHNIQTLPDLNSRNTTLGVQAALADLLTLSRTSLILGTYNSSFSWLASAWGLINLRIVRD